MQSKEINNRKRQNKQIEQEQTPPQNSIDPNISGLAKFSLNSDSADLNDLQAEIDAKDRENSNGEDDKKFKKKLMIVALSVIVVTSAISATVFQSMLLSADHYYFPFPIFSAAVTLLVQFLAAAIIIGSCGRLGLVGREIWSLNGWRATYRAILPCSVVTAAELGISLVSLQFVTVSFFTMVKSSSIIFLLIGSFMTGQERINAFLISVILLTGAGVTFAAWDPKSTVGVDIIGFGLVLISSILNALKWILTELLLNKDVSFKGILEKVNGPTKNQSKSMNLTPLLSVLLIAPITFLVLIIGAAIFEGFPLQMVAFLADESVHYLTMTMCGLLLSSVLVFILRVADFGLIQLVSLITFSLLGILKQVIMIFISVLFLGDILFPINILGLVMTIIGVGLYNYYRVMEERERDAVKKSDLEVELQLRKRNANQVTPLALPVK